MAVESSDPTAEGPAAAARPDGVLGCGPTAAPDRGRSMSLWMSKPRRARITPLSADWSTSNKTLGWAKTAAASAATAAAPQTTRDRALKNIR